MYCVCWEEKGFVEKQLRASQLVINIETCAVWLSTGAVVESQALGILEALQFCQMVVVHALNPIRQRQKQMDLSLRPA